LHLHMKLPVSIQLFQIGPSTQKGRHCSYIAPYFAGYASL
jgi:hypothetical protein